MAFHIKYVTLILFDVEYLIFDWEELIVLTFGNSPSDVIDIHYIQCSELIQMEFYCAQRLEIEHFRELKNFLNIKIPKWLSNWLIFRQETYENCFRIQSIEEPIQQKLIFIF